MVSKSGIMQYEDWQTPPKGEFWKMTGRITFGFIKEAIMNLIYVIFSVIFGMIMLAINIIGYFVALLYVCIMAIYQEVK